MTHALVVDELLVTYALGNAGVHTVMAFRWAVKRTGKVVGAERKLILETHVYHHKKRFKHCTIDACATL